MTEILLAGDNFIRNDLLADALGATLPGEPTFTSISMPWPQVPFGRVAEVNEASDCEDELLEITGTADVIVTQMAPITRRVLERAPALGLVVCTRGGPVNVNVEAAAQRDIAVSCTPGRNAIAAAEYAVLLMMAAQRRLLTVHNALVEGEWRGWMYDYSECGDEMASSTIGLVGLGEIGRRVADIVRGMGANVIAYDPLVSSDDAAGVELVNWETLLARSDIVSLHARLTSETNGMMGGAQLAQMKPGAILVNTARGALMDYDAAVVALESGQLGALALDVFPIEPVPVESALLKLPQVVLSPHLAGATRPTAARAVALAAAEVDRYLRGLPLLHVVNGVEARLPR